MASKPREYTQQTPSKEVVAELEIYRRDQWISPLALRGEYTR